MHRRDDRRSREPKVVVILEKIVLIVFGQGYTIYLASIIFNLVL
jgi:hypothetical protein